MAAPAPIATFDGVSKFYGTREALRNVSFQLPPGRVVGLLGPNGAGKSTTLSLLLGFIAPTSGKVALFAQSPQLGSSRKQVGYLPESPAFPEHHDSHSLLELHAALLGLAQRERFRAIDLALAQAGLDPAERRSVRGLSKGTLQRVALAVALLGDPELLVLDEPTSNLDPVGRRALCDLVRERGKQGRPVIFASHVLSEIEATCEHVMILNRGGLLRAGALSELCAAPGATLEQVFFETIATSAESRS